MKKIVALSAFVLIAVAHVFAQKAEVYSPGGKAIKGYDPVAFFTESKPVMGADSLSYSWNGATWLFANRQRRSGSRINRVTSKKQTNNGRK